MITDMINNNKKGSPVPEAEQLLQQQLAMSAVTKRTDITICVLFCAFVLAFAVAFVALPDRGISSTEKRELKQLPDVSLTRILTDAQRDLRRIFMTKEEADASGEEYVYLSSEIADYYADQFPLRDTMRTLKAATELLLCKQESNGILFAADGALITKDTVSAGRTPQDAEQTIAQNVAYIDYFKTAYLEETGADLVLAVAGRTVDVSSSRLPAFYPSSQTEAYWSAYSDALAKASLKSAQLRTPLSQRVENGEYVYYNTDHHWTSLGAYYAYAEIMRAFGEEPAALDAFTVEEVSTSFLGSVYAKAGASFSGADTISLYRFDGDEDLTMTIPVGSEVTTLKGCYNRKYLDTSDKYSLFLGHDNPSYGGNNPITYITKDGDESRETLVLIKDSFAHSVAPFLSYHYNLIIIDLRYYMPGGELKTVYSLACEENVKKVLVLYNMETFMNETRSFASLFQK